MRIIGEMKYTKGEVTKRIKHVEGVYYIDVTEEGKRFFGETIIESALVRLDIEHILWRYLCEKNLDHYLEGQYTSNKSHSEVVNEQGKEKVFEYIVNEILHATHKLQIDVSDGAECLVIRFTNGKKCLLATQNGEK